MTASSQAWRGHLSLAGLLELDLEARSADWARAVQYVALGAALLAGAATRFYGVFRFPFLDEEDRMVREAVNGLFGYGPQSGQAAFWENFLFRTPLTNSQAITPLWWWAEYLARLVIRDEVLSARLPTLLFGLLGLALFFALARRLLPSPVPVLLTWILAVHDIYLWVGTKAQYPETFLFVAGLLIAWGLLSNREGSSRWVVTALASTAAMGYFLLKGLTLTIGALAVASAQTLFSTRPPRGSALKQIAKAAAVGGLIALPLIAWLLAAQTYIAAHYQVRVGELGYFQSIGEVFHSLTFGYGTGRTASLVGPPQFAFIVYSQADAWPTSSLLFPLMLAGCGLALHAVAKPRQSGSRHRLALYVALIVGMTLTPVVIKGSFGERYHILYLPAALLAVGLVLERWWQARDGRWGSLMAFTGIWVGLGLSWADWVNGALRPGWPSAIAALVGCACGAVYAFSRSAAMRRAVVVAVIGLAVLLSLVRGPLHWGRFAAFGPEPRSWVLEQIQTQYHPPAR